jgi:hypothetical protein
VTETDVKSELEAFVAGVKTIAARMAFSIACGMALVLAVVTIHARAPGQPQQVVKWKVPEPSASGSVETLSFVPDFRTTILPSTLRPTMAHRIKAAVATKRIVSKVRKTLSRKRPATMLSNQPHWMDWGRHG